MAELHDIITTMVACAHAEDSIRKYEKNTYLAVVICSDATIFHNASAMRCDVFGDLWENRRAHHDGQAWASWWVFDGGHDIPLATICSFLAGGALLWPTVLHVRF